MKTFFYILQKKTNQNFYFNPVNNEIIPINIFDITDNMNMNMNTCDFKTIGYTFYINTIIRSMTNELTYNIKLEKTIRLKMKTFEKILKDEFMSTEFKENIIDLFSQSQKTYNALSKFAYLWRFKKAHTVVSNDLSMSPIDINDNKLTTYVLLQNNSKYLFNITELIKIIETALGNNCDFFSDPKPPKNPYNNLELNTCDMYNIYFKMKKAPRLISHIFHLYFLSNFCITNFTLNNEDFLLKNSIKKYVMNSPYTLLYNSALEMIYDNPFTIKLDIDAKFPKDVLVNIFRPYLYLYYLIKYYDECSKTDLCEVILFKKLMNFYANNKSFGRRYIKVNKENNKFSHTHHFNMNHLSFEQNIISKNFNYRYLNNNINLNDIIID